VTYDSWKSTDPADATRGEPPCVHGRPHAGEDCPKCNPPGALPSPFFRPFPARGKVRITTPQKRAHAIPPACAPESGCQSCYPGEHAYTRARTDAREPEAPLSAVGTEHAHFCPACLAPWAHVAPECGVTTRASAWGRSFVPSALYAGGEALCPDHAYNVEET
jgi:hypothetical protein